MKMRFTVCIVLVFLLLMVGCKPKEEAMLDVIQRSMNVAIQQSKAMANILNASDTILPRSIDPLTGTLITTNSRWWCSGFFPGTLWYLYEYSQDTAVKSLARQYTARIEREKFTTDNHDVGFMLYCSFGNGLRLTGNASYPDVLSTGSSSLATRFNPKVGLIRSWDFNKDKWQYPVIIDNMMNLELLMWKFKNSGDSIFYKMAVSHAKKTMENHYWSDNSCYHVVSYDTINGLPHHKQTWQGAADTSIWARGQAWGLYGYTMMYRETKQACFLEMANKIAALMIDHPNMPKDMIPYWDYLAPNITNEPRDASAAAIMASALIELSGYVNEALKDKYLTVAQIQLRRLSSPDYLAAPGTNGNFILKHSVGSKPHNSEVDVPLTYADYYFVEALVRLKDKL